MLDVNGHGQTLTMTPGALRTTPDEDVAVGRHLPPSSNVVADFMAYFAERYRLDRLGPNQRILGIAAEHHRLDYLHPFLDGNGRVSRLVSHAMAQHAGLGAHGLWSISRGLARGRASRSEYLSMMDPADEPRRGDLDGRGNLSLAALGELTRWFLEVCLDQIRFMTALFDLDGLADRLRKYASLAGWRPEASRLLVELLHRGEIARGDVGPITGLKERTARDVLRSLLEDGIVGSPSAKGIVTLRFPVRAEDVLFPRLFAVA